MLKNSITRLCRLHACEKMKSPSSTSHYMDPVGSTVQVLLTVIFMVLFYMPFNRVCVFAGSPESKKDQPKLTGLFILPENPDLIVSTRSQQFIVMGRYDDGLERDLTRDVQFSISNPAITSIDESGIMVSKADGPLELRADNGDLSIRRNILITGSGVPRPFDFTREIGGILTRRGCNTSSCHGSIKGRGGFKMSLNALNPDHDYEWITLGGTYPVLTEKIEGERIPRINLEDPEQSLILLKPTYQLDHEGGKRFKKDSEDYNTILEWIRQGAPREVEKLEEFRIEHLEVFPGTTLLEPGSRQQLLVTAHLPDGRTVDMTSQVSYEILDHVIARVDRNGQIRAGEKGETTLLVRAAGIAVNARIGVIGPKPSEYPELEERNFIDRHVFEKLKAFNITPSGPCTDEEFLRRVCLDLTGTLPPATRAREFLADPNPGKRDDLIEILLNTPEYVGYWTYRFSDLFRVSYFLQSSNKRAGIYSKWIRDSIAANKPFDQMARERIGGQGFNGPTRHYHHGGGEMPLPPNEMTENVVLFMGRRLDCAQCHDHPYEAWTQDQFWNLTAFFGRLTRLGWAGSLMVHFDDPAGHGEFGQGEKIIHPRRDEEVEPRFFNGEKLAAAQQHDPRRYLADWMTGHPFFAEAVANRMWSFFLGRGIVDPVDDFRLVNMPTHPELLEELAQGFRTSGYDLKYLMRVICRSNTYRMSGIPNSSNVDDELNYSWSRPRGLDAEVLFDAISRVTDVYGDFGDAHIYKQAINLVCPDLHRLWFLDINNQIDRTVVACRRNESNLKQALHKLTGSTYREKISSQKGRIEQLLNAGLADREIIEEFYLTALARHPREEELSELESMIRQSPDRERSIEDLLWAILTSPEFAFNN
jgi:hypothetical protein